MANVLSILSKIKSLSLHQQEQILTHLAQKKETVRTKNLIVHSNIPHSYIMVKDFKTRQPIFI